MDDAEKQARKAAAAQKAAEAKAQQEIDEQVVVTIEINLHQAKRMSKSTGKAIAELIRQSQLDMLRGKREPDLASVLAYQQILDAL